MISAMLFDNISKLTLTLTLTLTLLSAIGLVSCMQQAEDDRLKFLTDQVPSDLPVNFMEELIPKQKIVHRGVFSPDLTEYYYTISGKDFKQFEVFRIVKDQGAWSSPEEAFFNSKYDEHGMSFSPDGKTLYFSSTRPVSKQGIATTWHIWKSEKINGKWSEPNFVDIPNMKDKLVSHPTITNSGTLYFHASNLNYSDMRIYQSKTVNGAFGPAEMVSFDKEFEVGTCTPFVAPNEEYLIFATIGNELELMISYNNGQGQWSNPKKFNRNINTQGQGNPYVTPDNQFLFFATGGAQAENWKVRWVNITSEILPPDF